MTIGIFLGAQNSGKTLSMTYYAKRYQEQGYRILSNYKLNFPHEIITRKMIEEYTTSRKQFNKTVMLIDEIYLFFDARSFGKKSNRIFSYFVTQSSKNDVHILGTAQFFNTVELRFRNNASFKCFCSRAYKKEGIYYPVKSNIRFIETDDLYIKSVFVVRYVDGFEEKYSYKTYFIKADKVFDLYDTKELINIEE